jgi:hypothetical protein
LLFGLAQPPSAVNEKLKAQGFHHTLANNLNATTVPMITEMQIANEVMIASFPVPQQQHFHLLNTHHSYMLRPHGKPISSVFDTHPVTSAAFRRACKLLLIHRDPNRTSTAHVITKEILWKKLCSKTLTQTGVTDSEIRTAYRDYLRCGHNPHIIFYDKTLKQMPLAPWMLENYKHHFDKYKLQLDPTKSGNTHLSITVGVKDCSTKC